MRVSEGLRERLLLHASRVMMSRDPDDKIGGNYLHRWRMFQKSDPRSKLANVYVHCFLRDDIDEALHDHVCVNASVVLDGGYDEHFHAVPRSSIRRLTEMNFRQ